MSSTDDHDIRITGRKLVEVTGISSVESFDVNAFVLTTNAGPLQIHGSNLHMKHLDLQAGVVVIEGAVAALDYTSADGKKRRLVGRLLR